MLRKLFTITGPQVNSVSSQSKLWKAKIYFSVLDCSSKIAFSFVVADPRIKQKKQDMKPELIFLKNETSAMEPSKVSIEWSHQLFPVALHCTYFGLRSTMSRRVNYVGNVWNRVHFKFEFQMAHYWFFDTILTITQCSDRLNVRFGRTVRPNFVCSVWPKWQNLFSAEHRTFFFTIYCIFQNGYLRSFKLDRKMKLFCGDNFRQK